MKKVLLVIMMAAGTLGATAQNKYAGTQYLDRVGHGQDSVAVVTAFQLYRDAIKAKDYKEAYEPWCTVIAKAPVAQARIYTDGAQILQNLIANEKDPAKKKEYFDKLMEMYDTRLSHLDDLNAIGTEKTKTTKGNIVTRKMSDYFNFNPSPVFTDSTELKKMYPTYKDGIDDIGIVDVAAHSLQTFINVSFNRFAIMPSNEHRADFINDYLQTKEVCETLLEEARQYAFTDSIATHEDSVKAEQLAEKAARVVRIYEPVLDQCDKLFEQPGVIDCASLDALYESKVEANKADSVHLRKVLSVLANCGCDNSKLYNNVMDILYPQRVKDRELKADALAFYQEEYNNAPDNATKAKYAYNVAGILYKKGRTSDCINWCRKAIAAQPTMGNAYLLQASCIVRCAPAPNQDSQNMLKRSYYYCLAIDKCNRAKAVDPVCASRAARQAEAYKAGLFPRSEAFMMGLKQGQVVSILGEQTTLKF